MHAINALTVHWTQSDSQSRRTGTVATITGEMINKELPVVLSVIENKSSSVCHYTTHAVKQRVTLNLAHQHIIITEGNKPSEYYH